MDQRKQACYKYKQITYEHAHKDFKDPRKTHFGQDTKWIQEGIKVWPNKFVVQIISKKQITKDLFNKVQQMN